MVPRVRFRKVCKAWQKLANLYDAPRRNKIDRKIFVSSFFYFFVGLLSYAILIRTWSTRHLSCAFRDQSNCDWSLSWSICGISRRSNTSSLCSRNRSGKLHRTWRWSSKPSQVLTNLIPDSWPVFDSMKPGNIRSRIAKRRVRSRSMQFPENSRKPEATSEQDQARESKEKKKGRARRRSSQIGNRLLSLVGGFKEECDTEVQDNAEETSSFSSPAHSSGSFVARLQHKEEQKVPSQPNELLTCLS